jgi:uncharacterized protein
MPSPPASVPTLSLALARRIWLRAQRLGGPAPFGEGPQAVRQAIEHLGYVQIDTINVIERCHHHILFTRIPGYRRADLHQSQSHDKTVFEAWTHALAYVPTRDYRFFLRAMKDPAHVPARWFAGVAAQDLRKVLKRIEVEGPLTIRDIDDDVLVEKDHAWASRKPSKRAMQLAFHTGALSISARTGMLKTYDLTDRHFGWETRPKPASERQILDYILDRALRAQGVISIDSVCYLDAKRKAALRAVIEARVRAKSMVPVHLDGSTKTDHWVQPEILAGATSAPNADSSETVHILSPFDPLVIQRKRLKRFFGYEHRFEAYVPRPKRMLGYFALPVLIGDEIVAAIDLKTDRAVRTSSSKPSCTASSSFSWPDRDAPDPAARG